MARRTTRNPQPRPVPRSALRAPRSIVSALLHWFRQSARDLPWRRTRDPYAIWVSEIMLQQTQVKTVIPYWERWLRALPAIQSLAEAKPDTIHKLWEGLGYYTRVRNMQKAAQQICAEHGGTFPNEFEAMLALPGIGRYTAGAIASIAFNQPAPILDGNVIRVLCRLHGIAEDPLEKKTNTRLWELAEELVRTARATQHATRNTGREIKSKIKITIKNIPPCSALNQSLMELGALICTPRSPNCTACPIAAHCVARREERVEELPRPKVRAATSERRYVVFIIEQRGRFLVRQRREYVVNAHLWEFPNCEANGMSDPAELALQHLGTKPATLEKVCAIKHSITRYRITSEAHRVHFDPRVKLRRLTGSWCTLEELGRLAFTSAHRRIVSRLV
jgi:A/G-specific adenine glycosylase